MKPKASFPINDKNSNNIGKKINIAGLDKTLVLAALYQNLMRDEFIDPYDSLLMQYRFKENNFSLDWYNRNLYIDLAKDEFDPTKYDEMNNTYQRDDVQTAYQSIDALRLQIKLHEENEAEDLRLIKILFNHHDLKYNSDRDLYIADSSKSEDEKYNEILKMACRLQELGITNSAKREFWRVNQNPRIEINQSMASAVDKLRQHLLTEAINDNILACPLK